jgi:hypothetical protein
LDVPGQGKLKNLKLAGKEQVQEQKAAGVTKKAKKGALRAGTE